MINRLLVFTLMCAAQVARCAACPQATVVDVTARLLDGEVVNGALVECDPSKCSVRQGDKTVNISSSDLSKLQFASSLAAAKSPIEVLLTDGSRLYGNQLLGKGTTWTLATSSGATELMAKSIRSARLRSMVGEMESAWLALLSEPTDSDAVVVQNGKNLERINGIISQVTESNVSFELDGQPVDIAIEKLFGLIWFQRPLDRVVPTVEILTTQHSVWMAESFKFNESNLEIKTQLGHSVSVPLSKIHSIDYSSANIKWLADVEAIEAAVDKTLLSKSAIPLLEKALQPRFVVKSRAPVSSSGSADKDLLFPSPGRYSFRVPEGFNAFQTIVLRTDEGNQRSDITIEVWQEDEKLFSQAMPHDLESVAVNVQVKQGKRTSIAVTCASKLMIGTEVQWKQPRLKR